MPIVAAFDAAWKRQGRAARCWARVDHAESPRACRTSTRRAARRASARTRGSPAPSRSSRAPRSRRTASPTRCDVAASARRATGARRTARTWRTTGSTPSAAAAARSAAGLRVPAGAARRATLVRERPSIVRPDEDIAPARKGRSADDDADRQKCTRVRGQGAQSVGIL